MPVTNEVDASGNLTTITGTGDLTFGDVAEAMRAYYESPTPNVLWLLSGASLQLLPYPTVEKLAALLAELRKNARKGRTAIVSTDVLSYGVAREFEILVNLAGGDAVRETMAFQTVDEALAWLAEPET